MFSPTTITLTRPTVPGHESLNIPIHYHTVNNYRRKVKGTNRLDDETLRRH